MIRSMNVNLSPREYATSYCPEIPATAVSLYSVKLHQLKPSLKSQAFLQAITA